MKKQYGIVLLITLMVFVLAACGGANTSENAAAATNQPVKESATAPELSDADVAKANELTNVTHVLDWFAQPAHGGFFAAKAQSYFKDANLEVTLQSGGPQVSAIQIVASGQAQFGVESADAILLAREQGIPVVALAAVLQKSPSALFFHKENTDIKGFEDLNGHSVYASLASAYWEYLKSAYQLTDVKEFQFNGQYANFVSDPEALTQGYVTNTLADLEKQGVETNHLLIADSGYRPYYTILFTTESYLKEHPDVVKAYVQASIKGWNYYKEHPEEISEELVKVNPNSDADAFTTEAKAQEEFVFGNDAAEHGVGYMTEERWKELSQQLHDIGILHKIEDVTKAFTTEFLPGK